MRWVAATMDETLGVYPTKREALRQNTGACPLKVRRLRPGAYEARAWDGIGVMAYSFYVMTEAEADLDGIDWRRELSVRGSAAHDVAARAT